MKQILIHFAGELRDFAKTNACKIEDEPNGTASLEYNIGYNFVKEHHISKAAAFERRAEINRILEREKGNNVLGK